MYDFMRRVPLFEDLPDSDLRTIVDATAELHLAPGEELFAEGSAGSIAYVIKEGEVEITKQVDGRPVLLAVRDQPGEIIGEMALLNATPRMAGVRARTHVTLLTIHRDQFDFLVNCSPAAARIMLHTILTRWRATESSLRQSERMAQLGTLTAGLAHEMNNPAAAIRRSIDRLGSAVDTVQQAYGTLVDAGLSAMQIEALRDQARDRAGRSLQLSALERSDLEVEVETWLEAAGVSDGWSLAPGIVGLGYDSDELAAMAERYSQQHLTAIVAWLSAQSAVNDMVAEIGEGAQRISEVVNVLKGYVYLDQAPVQTVDIHEGIQNTLFILRHRLGSEITVQRCYGPDLPKVEALASELNQVWTNVIGNALDAMEDRGVLTITTFVEGSGVVIEIQDDGPGIPEQYKKRVFDPFFTTKPPGKGMGLGLTTAHSIVVHKHGGRIRLHSDSGGTRVQVWLPCSLVASSSSH